MNWYIEVLKKYTVFDGRARRAEYWYFALINIAVSIALSVVDNVIGTGGILGGIYGLGVLLPGVAVAIRRLHDTNRSGWWLLIVLVPIIGFFILLYFLAQDSQREPNQYGASPKYGMAAPPVA